MDITIATWSISNSNEYERDKNTNELTDLHNNSYNWREKISLWYKILVKGIPNILKQIKYWALRTIGITEECI